MMRNDSTSAISILQMDYGGDSDEEESGSKNNSRNNLEDDQTVVATDSVKIDVAITSRSVTADGDNIQEHKMMIETEIEVPKTESSDTEKDLETEKVAEEAKAEPGVSPAELISDDEDGDHPHHHHHHKHHHSKKDESRKQAVSESLNTDSPMSQNSQGSTKPGRKATRLVSYGPDEDVDEDDTSSEEEEEVEESKANTPELSVADASILSRSVQNMSSEDIQIPPEPTGKCSYQLQKKVEDMYERMKREKLDLNRVIQSKKNFRNPSIYEKLIDFCHIDEKGTNFPPDIYDPHLWGKESFYDELDKAQRKDMERREKEKKERTKIEFMTGTKKSAPSGESGMGPSDEKKRRTKWDAQPSGMIHVSKLPSAQQNPGVVNLTVTATGTKATVIPAVGNLVKKTSSK